MLEELFGDKLTVKISDTTEKKQKYN